MDVIAKRRSIRAFRPVPVPHEMLEAILQAGILAPSAKNRQPWQFVVATGAAKAALCTAFEAGLARERRQPLLPQSAPHLQGAVHSCAILRSAPAVIFVANRLGAEITRPLTPEEQVFTLCNAQSIGAAMENMSLRATALGLGSLWVCDTYFAQAELRAWLDMEGEPFAALAVGYPDEAPRPRPRRGLDTAVQWRD